MSAAVSSSHEHSSYSENQGDRSFVATDWNSNISRSNNQLNGDASKNGVRVAVLVTSIVVLLVLCVLTEYILRRRCDASVPPLNQDGDQQQEYPENSAVTEEMIKSFIERKSIILEEEHFKDDRQIDHTIWDSSRCNRSDCSDVFSSVGERNESVDRELMATIPYALAADILTHIPAAASDSQDSESSSQLALDVVSNECPICLSEYEKGDSVVGSSNLRCKHLFHGKCIEAWLLKRRGRGGLLCPCCRQKFVLPSSHEKVDNISYHCDTNLPV